MYLGFWIQVINIEFINIFSNTSLYIIEHLVFQEPIFTFNKGGWYLTGRLSGYGLKIGLCCTEEESTIEGWMDGCKYEESLFPMSTLGKFPT